MNHRDIGDLLDLAEVLVRTKASSDQDDEEGLSNEERKRKLQEIDTMRAVLHYRFEIIPAIMARQSAPGGCCCHIGPQYASP